jgi:hypothetical protein
MCLQMGTGMIAVRMVNTSLSKIPCEVLQA